MDHCCIRDDVAELLGCEWWVLIMFCVDVRLVRQHASTWKFFHYACITVTKSVRLTAYIRWTNVPHIYKRTDRNSITGQKSKQKCLRMHDLSTNNEPYDGIQNYRLAHICGYLLHFKNLRHTLLWNFLNLAEWTVGCIAMSSPIRVFVSFNLL